MVPMRFTHIHVAKALPFDDAAVALSEQALTAFVAPNGAGKTNWFHVVHTVQDILQVANDVTATGEWDRITKHLTARRRPLRRPHHLKNGPQVDGLGGAVVTGGFPPRGSCPARRDGPCGWAG